MGTIATAEDCLHEFLCGGLAVGTGHTYHRNVHLHTMMACQILQRCQHIVHQQTTVVHFGSRVAEHAKCGTLLQCLTGKSVTIESSPFESKEDTPGSDAATVCGHGMTLHILRIQDVTNDVHILNIISIKDNLTSLKGSHQLFMSAPEIPYTKDKERTLYKS